MQYEILFAAKNAGHSGIRCVRHWNEKTNNGGTSPVPDTGNTVGHFFFFLVRYQTEVMSVGLPMPAFVS
jgi:hypothetical protein